MFTERIIVEIPNNNLHTKCQRTSALTHSIKERHPAMIDKYPKRLKFIISPYFLGLCYCIRTVFPSHNSLWTFGLLFRAYFACMPPLLICSISTAL